ncbi:hypothetical protein SAICODRAFT_19824 [Saitoella complicata NRRL Y-17804]|uniref:uncharacterized protein n=1 Tax=Saitoella complicata (strain BCRC 22490 / CBS 7301 / JCM 7358 / NBRC 10748 / NRRL Y-17804) TaxID=698492 RepID=UPI000866F8A8|nr:uncharacterized protein SAICODRAFT_19824 [Saitoella complicata NRRL Y-17804]ODQ52248.1 hypothetical protein SAICODRAFT_19824 [Saitoella complicata NRRL Y-17804]
MVESTGTTYTAVIAKALVAVLKVDEERARKNVRAVTDPFVGHQFVVNLRALQYSNLDDASARLQGVSWSEATAGRIATAEINGPCLRLSVHKARWVRDNFAKWTAQTTSPSKTDIDTHGELPKLRVVIDSLAAGFGIRHVEAIGIAGFIAATYDGPVEIYEFVDEESKAYASLRRTVYANPQESLQKAWLTSKHSPLPPSPPTAAEFTHNHDEQSFQQTLFREVIYPHLERSSTPRTSTPDILRSKDFPSIDPATNEDVVWLTTRPLLSSIQLSTPKPDAHTIPDLTSLLQSELLPTITDRELFDENAAKGLSLELARTCLLTSALAHSTAKPMVDPGAVGLTLQYTHARLSFTSDPSSSSAEGLCFGRTAETFTPLASLLSLLSSTLPSAPLESNPKAFIDALLRVAKELSSVISKTRVRGVTDEGLREERRRGLEVGRRVVGWGLVAVGARGVERM